jgi:excisionase family DNA binding protein
MARVETEQADEWAQITDRKSKRRLRQRPASISESRRTYSVEEAGKILGVCRNSAYALARSGELPTIRMGRRLLVPREALDRLLAGI